MGHHWGPACHRTRPNGLSLSCEVQEFLMKGVMCTAAEYNGVCLWAVGYEGSVGRYVRIWSSFFNCSLLASDRNCVQSLLLCACPTKEAHSVPVPCPHLAQSPRQERTVLPCPQATPENCPMPRVGPGVCARHAWVCQCAPPQPGNAQPPPPVQFP